MMTKRNCLFAMILAVSSGLFAGCMPKFTIEELKNMTPERPVELDKLNMFLGEWESTSEIKMAVLDEVLTGTGTSTMTWELEDRYLIEHGTFDMGELGTMKAVGVWTYDPKRKKYLTWWFGSKGETGHGTVTYCEKTKTWTMKTKGQSPWGKSRGKGTVKFIDDDTSEWTWTEWDGTGLFKTMEMTGVNKRK